MFVKESFDCLGHLKDFIVSDKILNLYADLWIWPQAATRVNGEAFPAVVSVCEKAKIRH